MRRFYRRSGDPSGGPNRRNGPPLRTHGAGFWGGIGLLAVSLPIATVGVVGAALNWSDRGTELQVANDPRPVPPASDLTSRPTTAASVPSTVGPVFGRSDLTSADGCSGCDGPTAHGPTEHYDRTERDHYGPDHHRAHHDNSRHYNDGQHHDAAAHQARPAAADDHRGLSPLLHALRAVRVRRRLPRRERKRPGLHRQGHRHRTRRLRPRS
jgi:hypothetical protein